MKKAKRILLVLMSLVLMIECCGCGIFISERKLKKCIENALEEKYDEEFECFDVWSNRGDSYWGVCAPEKNHDIRFEALFLSDGKISEITYEGYYAACVAEQIEEDVQNELENVFDDFYLHSYMTVPLVSYETNDIYAEKARNKAFDIDEYVSLVKEKRVDPDYTPSISFVLCVNSSIKGKVSFEEEYDKLYSVFTDIEKVGINTIPYIKFLPDKVFSKCIDYFETRESKNSTFDDMVREYPIKNTNTTTLFVYFQECDLKLTKEEYIKQRKEVN